MSFDPVSYLMGRKSGGGGGGGNPNYVETIEGTLANPWGDYTESDLVELINSNNASICITIPNAGHDIMGLRCYFQRYVSKTHRITFSAFSDVDISTDSSVVIGAFINYRNLALETSGSCASTILYVDNGQHWELPDPTTPCTLTIIHHPLTGALTPAETQTFGGDA